MKIKSTNTHFIQTDKLNPGHLQKILFFFDSKGNTIKSINKYYTNVYNYVFDSRGNWTLRHYYQGNKLKEIIIRQIEYYKDQDKNETADFIVSKDIINKADSLRHAIPGYAETKLLKLKNRQQDIEKGDYGHEISVQQGNTLNDFLPKHWSLITFDSGKVAPYDSMVILAGYNTATSSEDGPDRCLGIFEKQNGILYLREQHYGTLMPNDDFSLSINDNKIGISYIRMRGESSYSYEYDFNKKDWRLIFERHTQRSCTNDLVMEYDYKNVQLHYLVYSKEEDSDQGDIDTTLTIKKKKLHRYMEDEYEDDFSDTVNIKGYGTIYF